MEREKGRRSREGEGEKVAGGRGIKWRNREGGKEREKVDGRHKRCERIKGKREKWEEKGS